MKIFTKVIDYIYLSGLFHHLYGIILWVILSAGCILAVQDFWRGLGIASAYTLFQYTNVMYYQEREDFYRKMMHYAKPNEAQGE